MSELFTSGSVGGMGRKPCPYPEVGATDVGVALLGKIIGKLAVTKRDHATPM